jgi:hypothetical protein
MPEFDWRAADASGQITQGRQEAAWSHAPEH